jgi:phytanoyl-CoA hydroxylase
MTNFRLACPNKEEPQAVQAQIERLRDQGYVVVPRFVPPDTLVRLNEAARLQLAGRADPLEFEADLQYPGAPPSRTADGGATVRRLLDAYGRDPAFAQCATAGAVREWMRAYFRESVLMSRAHHNCLMTKHPLHGSLTGWHRDIRYWSFEREELVSAWFALGSEEIANGALWFVPGSHRMTFEADRYDGAKFFRAEHQDNAKIIGSRESPRLAPGDAVFFHCKTLHCAGRNQSAAIKFSLVFSYHGRSNAPCQGSRSSSKPEVPLD